MSSLSIRPAERGVYYSRDRGRRSCGEPGSEKVICCYRSRRPVSHNVVGNVAGWARRTSSDLTEFRPHESGAGATEEENG